jgi:very-short-patch-repair endonuclease
VKLVQLLAAGLTKKAISRRVADGRLHRLYRGVYAVGHPGLSREGQWLAAVYACGEPSALSHLSAGRLVEISRFRAPLAAVVTATQRRPEGIDVHHCKRLDPRDVTRVNGIPCCTVPRILIDASDLLTPHQVANLIHEAEFKRHYDPKAVRQAMARANGRKNLHVLEEAIRLNAQGSAGTRSHNEDQLLHQLQLFNIDTPLVNTKVNGIEVDLYWPDTNLIVEVDGHGHNRPRTMREDGDRARRLSEYELRRVAAADALPPAPLGRRSEPRA